MKSTKIATFKLAKDTLLSDFDAIEAGINRFLGRELKHPWKLTNTTFTLSLPLRVEYRQALQEGVLEEVSKSSP